MAATADLANLTGDEVRSLFQLAGALAFGTTLLAIAGLLIIAGGAIAGWRRQQAARSITFAAHLVTMVAVGTFYCARPALIRPIGGPFAPATGLWLFLFGTGAGLVATRLLGRRR